MFHKKTAHAAKGKWRGILLELGVPSGVLVNKHGPCPMCGGVDRFRWDNKDGAGTYICSHCGAGDGMRLAMEFTGQTFKDIASRIDSIVGNVTADTVRQERSDGDARRIMRETYAMSRPIETGDLADIYLRSRGIGEMIYPKALRFVPSLRDGNGGIRPCMIALVGVYGEPKFATMHRTYLRPDGKAKAEMDSPRKLMPGRIPDGACVALSDWSGGALGIAEGIETAMSASVLYEMPVWSALTAGLLAKWSPPDGCEDVAIFGDNDASYTGQAAAYGLARRLAAKGISTTVHIPPTVGEDWNDVLQMRAA